jgi:predicted transcriptional regulator/predicted O-methyltransferase YrrM
MDNNNNSLLNFQDLRNFIYSFQKSRIVLTAYELDIFSVLDNAKKTSYDVAKNIDCDHRATDRLMNALVAIGFINKSKDVFFNSEIALRFLSKNSPEYLAGLMHSVNLWKSWSNLTDCVKKGSRVQAKSEFEKDPDTMRAFIAAMHDRGTLHAENVISKLDLKNVKSIIDIGGGSGAYSFAFVKAKNDLIATIFDLPDIIKITNDYIINEGMQEKINLISGNYLIDEFGKGYDLAFLSAIIHINSFEQNKSIVVKCFEALNPGGYIVIQDHIMSSDRTSPPEGAIFSLNMLVGTECGDTYTENEIKEWLTEAEFVETKIIPTKMNSIIVAQKPK